ncbi:hypothetical protein Tco_0168621 [Tanacetum coccineum]
MGKSKETCFTYGKLGHFQKDYPSNKTSTPSYPSSSNSFNKSKPYTPPFTQTSSQNIGNHQKDYKGKYKGLKADMAVLTKRIDDLTKGKSEKGKNEKEDEPSVRKADARSGQWVDITIRKTYSKVTLDQLLFEQVPGNIVKALGGRGRRKEEISIKEVAFTKAGESSFEPIPEITSDSEFECETQEPLPPLPKLIGAEPAGTSNSLISLADLTLNTKRTENKSLAIPDKKANLSTDRLLLTLMEEVKGLKRQMEIPSGTSPSNSQSSSSKSTKQKTWFGPCKYCGLRNHLTDDFYLKPKCSTCGSTDHLTKEHIERTVVNKPLTRLKAQSSVSPSTKKALMIPKPFKECKYCGFNDHHYDNCEYYPGCEVCGSIAHEPTNCPKKHPNSRNPRISNKRST